MRSPFKKEEAKEVQTPQAPVQPQPQSVEAKEKAEEKLTIVTSEQMINIKLDAIMSELKSLTEKFDLVTKQ